LKIGRKRITSLGRRDIEYGLRGTIGAIAAAVGGLTELENE